jgi:hypothetical protein
VRRSCSNAISIAAHRDRRPAPTAGEATKGLVDRLLGALAVAARTEQGVGRTPESASSGLQVQQALAARRLDDARSAPTFSPVLPLFGFQRSTLPDVAARRSHHEVGTVARVRMPRLAVARKPPSSAYACAVAVGIRGAARNAPRG